MAAGVVSDQAEADEDMSIQQRLALAGGSTLGGAGEMVGDMTDIPLAGDALQVAGESHGSYFVDSVFPMDWKCILVATASGYHF